MKVGEKDVVVPKGCKLENTTGLGPVSLTKAHNEYTVVNIVKCHHEPPPPPVEPRLEKHVISTTQLPSGDWLIVYRVVVSNDGKVALKYDLYDTLAQYGEGGITVTDADWSGPGGTSGSWSLPNLTTLLADDAELGPHAQAVYTVGGVTAAVASEAGFASAKSGGGHESHPKSGLKCLGGEKKGAFNNLAVLEVGKKKLFASDCSEPASPKIEKKFLGAEYVGDPGDPDDVTFEVSYLVTVTNPSSTNLVYDLSDSLDFPDGVVSNPPRRRRTRRTT